MLLSVSLSRAERRSSALQNYRIKIGFHVSTEGLSAWFSCRHKPTRNSVNKALMILWFGGQIYDDLRCIVPDLLLE